VANEGQSRFFISNPIGGWFDAFIAEIDFRLAAMIYMARRIRKHACSAG
jgi:hypothetical protein